MRNERPCRLAYWYIALTLLASSLPAGAWAQDRDSRTVAGQSTATIERPAEIMRMQIDLSAKDKDPKEAAAKFTKLKDAATAKLAELGALQPSVKLSEPSLGTMAASSEAQMERMVYMRMQGKKVDEEKLAAMPVTVTARLTAEWQVSGDSPLDRLLFCHELQKKIKAADVAGIKDAKPLTPEEQEAAEESSDESRYGMPQAVKPGEPVFIFVAKISDEDQKKALAQAYQRASGHPQRLAETAEFMRLGDIHSLSGTFGSEDLSSVRDPYTRYMASMMGPDLTGSAGDGKPETIGADPCKVKYHLVVNVTFNLVIAGTR